MVANLAQQLGSEAGRVWWQRPVGADEPQWQARVDALNAAQDIPTVDMITQFSTPDFVALDWLAGQAQGGFLVARDRYQYFARTAAEAEKTRNHLQGMGVEFAANDVTYKYNLYLVGIAPKWQKMSMVALHQLPDLSVIAIRANRDTYERITLARLGWPVKPLPLPPAGIYTVCTACGDRCRDGELVDGLCDYCVEVTRHKNLPEGDEHGS